MFPDSALARNFACGATKSRYMITFGLAPYFLDALKDKVKLSSDYVLLFDESLNKKNKMKQMDFHVRFWNENIVQTRYITSEFLGHAASYHLESKIEDVLNKNGFARKKTSAAFNGRTSSELEML